MEISELKLRKMIKEVIKHTLKENWAKNWKGGTEAVDGSYIGRRGLQKILQLSKKNPNKTYVVTDDNYFNIGRWLVKNGETAKWKTIGNPAYDLARSQQQLKVSNDVILKFAELEI